MPEQFPLETVWGSNAQQEAWREQLERTGLEGVRLRMAQNTQNSFGNLAIGTETSVSKGFIEEWLAWHEKQRQKADDAHRATVTWWTKAAAMGALAAALFTLIGAIAAVGQAIFAWLALPPRP